MTSRIPPASAGLVNDSLRAALRGGLAFCAVADTAQHTNVAITNKVPGIRFDFTTRFLLLVWVTEGLGTCKLSNRGKSTKIADLGRGTMPSVREGLHLPDE